MAGKNDLLNTLLSRAEQSEKDKLKIRKIRTKCLGDITLKIPPLEKVAKWVDDANSEEEMSTYDGIVSNADIVFQSIPFLKEYFIQLSEAYDEKDPAVLTVKIFEASGCLNELSEIASLIVDSLGAGKETVKNL